MAPVPVSSESSCKAGLFVRQAWPSCNHTEAFEGGASAAVAAEALLSALKIPVTLEWQATLEDGTCVVMSAELSTAEPSGISGNKWPPRRVSFKVIPAIEDAGYSEIDITVPSTASVDQLTELINGSKRVRENSPAAITPSPDTLQSLSLIAADEERHIFQPRCLQQWHGDICGHHALFNARCLLLGEVDMLQDAERFWQHLLEGVAELAEHGERSKRWQKSRVVCGMADGVHLRHLVDSDSLLRGRVTIVESTERLSQKLRDPEAEVQLAIAGFPSGRGAHAFLLGATNHWYAAVAIAAPGDKGGPQLWFCDSYNKGLVHLRTEEDVEEMLERLMIEKRADLCEVFKQRPEWSHRPQDHIDAAVEDGVQEWWKGHLKSALFWRDKPLELRRQLMKQELNDVREYMEMLISALK